MKRILRALLGLAVAASLAAGAWRIVDSTRARRELAGLRERVARSRISADSCTNVLAYDEMLFRRFDTIVDSLRGEIRGLERLDPRGVPQSRYEEYLERVGAYNDSVVAWRSRADELRAGEAACRTLIEVHNALSDSVRQVLGAREAGGGG